MGASNKSSSESDFFQSVIRFRSWEEEAFAEDAVRVHGALTWPPRFYSCSFCGRQFKSAQALGGHMNVHRRDKARLKQSPIQNHSESRTADRCSKICTLVCNPTIDAANSRELPVPSLDNIRASAPLTLQSSDQAIMFSTIQDSHQKLFNFSSPTSCPDSASNVSFCSVLDTKIEEECMKKQKHSRHQEPNIVKLSDDYLPAVNLNLVDGFGKEEIASCKRSKNDDISLEATIEDSSLDLELRLGDQPKVK